MLHPRKTDKGEPLTIKKPSTPTPLDAWWDDRAVACVIPDGEMPHELGNIPFSSVQASLAGKCDWEAVAATMSLQEPEFQPPPGLKASAGVVIREPDGRIWLVAPSNQFGGYTYTFPKGRLDGKSLKATALVEAFEECGLQVFLTGFLVDVPRSTTYTRYYMAERITGNPADMGWESQAVLLAPVESLTKLLTNANDLPIIRALQNWLANPFNQIVIARSWHWKTCAMPEQRTTIPLAFHLNNEQAAAIRLGFVPKEQEEKWFAYFVDNTLFQHRSWTGFCIDQIHFIPDKNGLLATHATVNRDPEEYACTSDREDAERIESLVFGLAEHNLEKLREAR